MTTVKVTKMRHFLLGLLFWVAVLTSAIQVNFCLATKCLEVCPDSKTILVPTCNGTRIEPNYHENCSCLLGYKCCPHECPQINKTCKKGLEIPVPLEDCCQCPMIRCDACPKREDPKCVPGCEELETLSDISNGCHFNSCKVVCPQLDEISCPNCQIPEAFTNSSFCSCTQQRCVAKPCPPKKELPPKDCALRKWAKTECGCDKQFYDKEHYCDDHNAAAAAYVCENKCFVNEVLQGKGPCGCDKPQCFQINEQCLQTFEGWDCPAGTVKQTGTTPCGLRRDVCIKCDIIQFNNKTCDPQCYTIVESKDVNGCPTEKCERNPCPAVQQSILSDPVFFNDKCACVSGMNIGLLTAIVDGKMWLVIQKREDVGSTDGFDKNWNEYKMGFGEDSAYWLGLEKMHLLTKSGKWEVLLMGKHKTGSYAGKWGILVYDEFRINDEASGYKLTFGARLKKENSGEDSYNLLKYHKNKKFSSKDNDTTGCATEDGWWYGSCDILNLNDSVGEWTPEGDSSQTLMAMRQT